MSTTVYLIISESVLKTVTDSKSIYKDKDNTDILKSLVEKLIDSLELKNREKDVDLNIRLLSDFVFKCIKQSDKPKSIVKYYYISSYTMDFIIFDIYPDNYYIYESFRLH